MSEGSEGSTPRPVRRKIKKVMVLSSASESDSDDGVVAPSTRRKRMRVLSDGESSSSSGSAVVAPARRRRALPALRSDGDSDSSGSGGWGSDRSAPAPPPAAPAPASGFASDSSEGNSDKCSICLLRFKDQEVGIPEACEHIFCLDCITEWSKNVNTCPVDRSTFNSITVRACAGGRVLRREAVKVTERRPSVELLVVEESTPCEVCGRTDNEETMLLCDGCDRGYHMQCLTPPLTEVPIDQWLCPNCEDLLDVIHLSELDDLFSGIEDLDLPEGPRIVSVMTGRNRIDVPSTSGGRRGTGTSRRSSDNGPSTSQGSRGSGTSTSSRSANHTTRRRTAAPRRRKYKRRTRTVVIEYEIEENGKFPVTRTVKRKIKKKRSRRRQPRTVARRSHVRASVRAKLAASAAVPAASSRQLVAPTLSLFGDMSLDYFSDDEPELGTATGPCVAARPAMPSLGVRRQVRRKAISIPSPPHSGPAPDLLGDILSSQTLLHSRGAVLSLSGDGSLRIDPREGGGARGRQAPAYHGQQRGMGAGHHRQPPPRHQGWGGGYTGARVPPAAPSAHRYSGASSSPPGPPCGPPTGPPGPAPRSPPPRRTPRPPVTAAAPLPAPPVFRFDSDEEPSELMIDTDKYDPTEPTQDEDDCPSPPPPPAPTIAPSLPSPPALPPPLAALASPVVPALPPPPLPPRLASVDRSDDESDGDCPNFAIYSATSVHIASNTSMEPGRGSAEDEYKARVSRRCPITTSTRNPIKIKLTTPALLKRPLSLYDDDEPPEGPPDEPPSPPRSDTPPEPPSPPAITTPLGDTPTRDDNDPVSDDAPVPDEEDVAEEVAREPSPEENGKDLEEEVPMSERTPSPALPSDEGPGPSEGPGEEGPDGEAPGEDPSPPEPSDDAVEKMTESISETEDERSYTPCLDENKSKDTSLETDKDKALEGLDTEMISEEEGNGLFSDEENRPPSRAAVTERRRRKDKRDTKEKRTKPKRTDVTFKKLGKSGKERNYRDKERDRKRKDSDDERERKPHRKEKRKDLERYDVRSVVGDKRRRVKDAFGRDVSPAASPSPPPGTRRRRRRSSGSPRRKSLTPRRKSISPRRRSISPRRRSISPRRRSISPRRRSITPRRRSISPRRRSISPRRRSISPRGRRRSISPRRKSMTPRRKSISPRRKSISPRRRSKTPRRKSISPRRRLTISPRRKSISPRRKSITPRRKSITPRRKSLTPRRKSPTPRKKSPSPRRKSITPRRKSVSPSRAARRRRSGSGPRKRRRSGSAPPVKAKTKKKKRARSRSSERPVAKKRSPRRKVGKNKRAKRSVSPSPLGGGGGEGGGGGGWSGASLASALLSPALSPRREPPPPLRRRARSKGPSKEVFTSGDNILVSVSFKDQERDRAAVERRKRKEAKRDKRRKRRRAAAAATPLAERAKPVAIIDLERSPFRELTPSPKNVIVLSDSDHGEAEAERAPPPEPHVGPKTPPEPAAGPPHAAPQPADEGRGPSTPPDSPDAYDPFEPTRSASGSPAGPAPAPPPPATMTLEAAQKTNMSADDVIDRRPISPIEKVMALLQSTRDVSPEPPPEGTVEGSAAGQAATAAAAAGAAAALGPPVGPSTTGPPGAGPPTASAAPRIVLPSPTRAQAPKLFLAKPSPIKSNPVKPMQVSQATKISRLPLPVTVDDESPYSPGSSDFGDLFSPPGASPRGQKRDTFDALFDRPPKQRRGRSSAAKVPVKLTKKGNKTQVGVKIDEDNLKILDDLPSSAVEMQVKSKFLKKLNRQERVVEEVKLVLKPHYNKKHVTKDEYKDILRRAVPKICHNKTGEINPAKIQALVEAYVKKYRKKHKLGLL